MCNSDKYKYYNPTINGFGVVNIDYILVIYKDQILRVGLYTRAKFNSGIHQSQNDHGLGVATCATVPYTNMANAD